MSFPLEHLEDKYEILGKLREGGMGAIYKVRHRVLDDIRVIKVMLPSTERDATFRQRFLNEARTAINLRNDNLVMIYDCRIDDAGRAYIVMEFIDGQSLRELVDDPRPLPLAVALELARQGLAALRYLHRKGIVHRDISPDNLMVGLDEAGEPTVKLIDLGIAKAKEEDSGLTDTGVFIGKFKYCAPEQFGASGSKGADERCDIYSFGIVMYELLTSHHPFPGNDGVAVIAAHLYSPPLDFATSDPDGRVPDELRQVVLRALEKRPADRWQSAAAMLAALPTGPAWTAEQFRQLLERAPEEPPPERPTTTETTARLRRGRQRSADGRQRAARHPAAARPASPSVEPAPATAPPTPSGVRLALPCFAQPVWWPQRGLPTLAPLEAAPELDTEALIAAVTFRSGRLADVVAVAILELFMGRNLVELASGRAVVELVTRMDRAGLLTGQVAVHATTHRGSGDAASAAALESELNPMMIRALRSIKHAVEPSLAPLLRRERRQVSLKVSLAPPDFPVCGWLVPLADGAPQSVELSDRATGEPLAAHLPAAAASQARVAVLLEQRLVIVGFDLVKAAARLCR